MTKLIFDDVYNDSEDVLDIIPGYDRIDGRTVKSFFDVAVEATPQPDSEDRCDDCGQLWGECNSEVEH